MSGRHILITGASGGLGAALARHYAAPGVALLLVGRNVERLARVVHECRAKGADVRLLVLDVRESAALHELIAKADAQRPIDTVFANAGVEASLGPLGEAEALDDVLAQIRTNFEGAVVTVQPLIDPMRARGQGRIVLVASLAGRMPLPDQPTYSATKAGLIAYGEALRPVLAAKGVSLTIACPGFIDTGMARTYRGWRPLQWSAERAAATIARATERGARSVSFPFALAGLVALGRVAPPFLRETVLRRLFAVDVRTEARAEAAEPCCDAASPRSITYASKIPDKKSKSEVFIEDMTL
ncbi:SDR family NAD(P)-dependent oxidoreductase [Ancylobacter radicis]|uniref:SDR family NAD(P)-dependent oxidoreductase n=1 Tax=Ancylobacter radicis TaxID=2836179 RepID=A0ABS5RF00_9HYPH|nr:SDR family NAD(P)-dependent oxidoreductase [Ancylobacter radicis]MBS9478932.1 SDR family NAD(P)-dependent oxidoreductase [Ancylobacter radicis]